MSDHSNRVDDRLVITKEVRNYSLASGLDLRVDNQQLQNIDESEQAEMARRAKHHKKWNRRMKVLFCCLGYKKNKVSYLIKC